MAAGVADIEALLPQTQCRQCGHAGCRPYAEALLAGDTPLDRCAPGGWAVLAALADALGRAGPRTLPDEALSELPARVARIREPDCIGCVKCLDACPVDAIVGAAKFAHTVIEALCTGCGLCLPPCPVDCIALEPGPLARPMHSAQERAFATGARARFAAHERRHRAGERNAGGPALVGIAGLDAAELRAAVAAAVRRVRGRQSGSAPV